MEQIIIKNGVIVSHIDAPVLHEGAAPVTNFKGVVGSQVAEYDAGWNLLPIQERIEKGLVQIPVGYKVQGEYLVSKTEIEKIIDGDVPCPDGYIVVGGAMRPKTTEDMYSAGEISRAEYVEKKNIRICEQRRAAYEQEADHLFFEEQRGAVPEGTWKAKITEIKDRLKKVE